MASSQDNVLICREYLRNSRMSDAEKSNTPPHILALTVSDTSGICYQGGRKPMASIEISFMIGFLHSRVCLHARRFSTTMAVIGWNQYSRRSLCREKEEKESCCLMMGFRCAWMTLLQWAQMTRIKKSMSWSIPFKFNHKCKGKCIAILGREGIPVCCPIIISPCYRKVLRVHDLANFRILWHGIWNKNNQKIAKTRSESRPQNSIDVA